MKALVYEKAHSLADFAIKLVEIPIPTLRENDVLIDVRAIGVNPGEAAIRSMRSVEPGGRVLLVWEFAGVVSAVGAAVARFKVGDRVFGTGDMTRDGCWAESVAVDRCAEATGEPALPLGVMALPSSRELSLDPGRRPSTFQGIVLTGTEGVFYG
jgi:NADPH:quinone reductase-like Zn-dependent oxidoreductase